MFSPSLIPQRQHNLRVSILLPRRYLLEISGCWTSNYPTAIMATPRFNSKSPTIKRIRKLHFLFCPSMGALGTFLAKHLYLQFVKLQKSPIPPPPITTPLRPQMPTSSNGTLHYEARHPPRSRMESTTAELYYRLHIFSVHHPSTS